VQITQVLEPTQCLLLHKYCTAELIDAASITTFQKELSHLAVAQIHQNFEDTGRGNTKTESNSAKLK
jgi:hypothetical protein